MSVITATALDPLRLPLTGERLIEASAGTGKTYTIAALYLRLLLGLGGDAAAPRPLRVEELLVVTFTEAATAELRGRIRSNIHELRIACLRGRSDNPLMTQLMAEISSPEAAAHTLLLAERQMDEAAIFTIHGFCQRMLSLNAFESGLLFEQRLIEDEQPLRQRACADFWRRHCYPLPRPVAAAVSALWSGPENLLLEIQSYLHGDKPQLVQPVAEGETLEDRHRQIISRISDFKQRWRETSADVADIINGSGVDKRSYSSRYLPGWLSQVGEWAEQESEDYRLPDALNRFGQRVLEDKTKKGEVPRHPLFTAVDELLAAPLSIKDLVISRALTEIRDTVAEEKRRRGELGFDDMLSRLDLALAGEQGEALARAIRSRYPVAMIDEFQDTDPQQYRIFRHIWLHQPECALLLIGDPKQAIYAFRGADIFTYMRARKEVSAHYTLETNWRSSPAMVNSVNTLFQRVPDAFLFKDIPFLAVNSSPRNQGLRFTINGAEQPAMTFWQGNEQVISVNDYQQMMARQCASEIRHWLSAGQRGDALLWRGDKSRPVAASDITVLVRSRQEAGLIRDALNALNIPSVYLSNRDSVFTTPEARELLWVLQAVLNPERENLVRNALATALLGLDASRLDALNQDEQAWEHIVEEFDDYRQRWLRRGVMPMLREMLSRRQVAETLLTQTGGERRLTDVLHLCELLQEAAGQLDSEHALTRWLAQRISEPDRNASSQQLRLESDRHLVQVVTIHKSKGLEYSLVWLPFIASFRPQSQVLYHDRTSFTSLLDIEGSEQGKAWAEEERLAEDLRLLYVAVTRAIWHCSIGIAPLVRGTRSKSGTSDLHLSALGYLIQRGEALTGDELGAALATLAGPDIALCPVSDTPAEPWQPQEDLLPDLAARTPERIVDDQWRVTSYSGLQQHGKTGTLAQDLLPRFDIDAAEGGEQPQEQALSPYDFPRGAGPGTFLHSLFEQIDFREPVSNEWLAEQLQLQGFEERWQPVLAEWLPGVLGAPLSYDGLTLSALGPKDTRVELEFYLPIDGLLDAKALDNILRRYDPLSANCPALDFRQVQGMLKGFIDLVFRWQGRYYLLDYKSNWLGSSGEDYRREAMEQAMCQHRYDLQYQLYSLALHRYLRQRLTDYDYQHHFGGVIYLFLRGVTPEMPGQGIFTTRPQQALIDEMDVLFSGEAVTL
ncbi:RecBCD enzyme subunit RecB [Salmonella enterica subsp. enterica serovar Choleraesuis]|nr:RecBCD enzyme subunit RecB [Salmonella enterica subsp. enterica serovar Choleraesuis]